jgi:hypothetical protein
MFISEIPVCCISSEGHDEKITKWIGNLNHRTTVRDVIRSIFPAGDPTDYSLYIHTDCKKQVLNDSARIYKIVANMNTQKKSSRRLLFEIRVKKRVRFADEILVQNIIQGQCISNEKMTNNLLEIISIPPENFQKHVYQEQKNYMKSSFISKR